MINHSADPSDETGLALHLLRCQSHKAMKLAQCLHKEAAGNVAACAAGLEVLRHELQQLGQADRLQPMLAGMDSAMHDLMSVIRGLIEELYPPVLRAFGVSAALEHWAREMDSEKPGRLVLTTGGEEPPLDPVRRLLIFRLLQRLIGRCSSPSPTLPVKVTLTWDDDVARVTIDSALASQGSSQDNSAEVADECDAYQVVLGASVEHLPVHSQHASRTIASIPCPAGSAPVIKPEP